MGGSTSDSAVNDQRFDVVFGASFLGVPKGREHYGLVQASLPTRLASLLAPCRSAMLVLVAPVKDLKVFLALQQPSPLTVLERAHVYTEPENGEPFHLVILRRSKEAGDQSCRFDMRVPPALCVG